MNLVILIIIQFIIHKLQIIKLNLKTQDHTNNKKFSNINPAIL